MFSNCFGIILILFSCVYCKAQKPPTQPSWLIDAGKKVNELPKVEVTLKNLLETAKIRSEIESTVIQHKYAIGRKDEDKIVAEVDKVLGEEYRIGQRMKGLVGDPSKLLGAEEGNEEEHLESLGEGLSHIISNRVYSALSDDNPGSGTFIPEYNASKYHSDNDYREVLQLIKIEENLNFNLEEGTRMWKTFPNGELVGLSDFRLQIATKVDGIYRIRQELNSTSILGTMDTITLWNVTRKSSSSLILLSSEDSLDWLLADSLEIYWKWKIGARIQCIQSFEVENLTYVALLVDGYILIYQYDLERKEYWSNQVVALDTVASEIVFLNTGYHMILAVPQNNSVLILRSKMPQGGVIHFVKLPVVVAEAVTSVAGFQMGGYTYLAIGGNQPKILRYHQGTFTPQTILDLNFGFVDMFLPVPCRTYRDDLILLVQHRIIFQSHSLTVVEALIWNGQAFEATKSVPCNVGSRTSTFGVSCMLDMELESGIRGAAVIDTSQEIAVIAPRFEASSGFFRIFTELVPKQTELEDIEAILSQMEALAAQQDIDLQKFQNQSWTIDVLEAKNVIFNGWIDKILLNDDEVWTNDDSAVDINILIEDLELLIRQTEHLDEMKMEHVIAKHLLLETINEKPYREIQDIYHEGTVVFEGDLTVNEIPSVIKMKSREFNHDNELDLIRIEGNLDFDTINGILWTDFITQVIYKNVPEKLKALEITQEVTLNDGLETDKINGLEFPNNFLLSSGPTFSIITGKKKFTGILNSNAFDCDGVINEIDPYKIISLSDDQTIMGRTTFNYLEVTEMFEVNGTISGENLQHFLSNPTLQDTRSIEKECHFKYLQVFGPIVIKGFLNQRHFDRTLNDVVYYTDKNVTISAMKSFQDVQFGNNQLYLTSGRVGGIGLEEFLTKSTDQEIEIKDIEGSANFEVLTLDGLFNFINVTEMDLNSIKLWDDQVIDTNLIFKDPQLLSFNRLDVTSSLNHNPLEKFLSIRNPIYLEKAIFKDIDIDQLLLECDIEGSGLLNNENMDSFVTNRLSIAENQTLNVDLITNRIEVEQNLVTKSINEYPAKNLLRLLEKRNNFADIFQSNQIQIDQMKITGNVRVEQINRKNAAEIWSEVIWLDRENKITSKINFLDDIRLDRDIIVENHEINGRNFEDLINSLAFKTNRVDFKDPVKFTQPVQVMYDSEVSYFNDISAENIALKNKPINFKEDLYIDGDLNVEIIELGGSKFGDFNIQELRDYYKYNLEEDMHYIAGEVIFKGQIQTESLEIGGNFNGLESPDNLFKRIVYKNSSGKLTGRMIFKDVLTFEAGIHVESFKGINLPAFFQNVVYVNSTNPVEIAGSVQFTNGISSYFAQVERDISTTNIMGCLLEEWVRNTLRIDRTTIIDEPMVFLPGTLSYNNLNAVYLNGRLMDDLITLHTPQNFTGTANLTYVGLEGTMLVTAGVNGYDLETERKNTLMIYGDNHVIAPTTMQSFQVLRNMETLGSITNRNLRKLALLRGDLQFRSGMSFREVRSEALYTNDLITGLNFTNWYRNSLKNGEPYEQIITGNWNIDEITVNNGTVKMDPSQSDYDHSFRKLLDKYTGVCHQVRALTELSNKRVSSIKYFEKRSELLENETINAIHKIEYPDTTILIVNKRCFSNIYQWNANKEHFEQIQTLETGHIDQVEISHDHIVLRNFELNIFECNLHGWKCWNYNENRLIKTDCNHYSEITENHRNKRSTDNENNVSHHLQLFNFNSTFLKITKQLTEDLHTIRKSSNASEFVAASRRSSFTHTLRHVASKLWERIKQLDDVKTIMKHARVIYKTIVQSYHDSGNITHDNSTTQQEDLVGAQTPDLIHIFANSNPTLKTLTHVLDTIPLGFRNLVENTTAQLRNQGPNDNLQTQVEHFIQLVVRSIHPNANILGNPHDPAYRQEVGKSMVVLKQYVKLSNRTEYDSEDNRVNNNRTGEAIVFQIGSKKNRRTLIAVTSPIDYYSIRMYVDVVQGDIFQTIEAANPSSLVASEYQDETIFGFVENSQLIRLMQYRGVEGFVDFSKHQLSRPVTQLLSIIAPKNSNFCRKLYLLAVTLNCIKIYEAVTDGPCPVYVTADKDCRGW